MSRPRNHGTHAYTFAKKRLESLGLEMKALTEESLRLAEFLQACEDFDPEHQETPTDQLQPQAVGSAEQGNGAPSHGDGTALPSVAAPCSAEEQDTFSQRDSGGSAVEPSTPRACPELGEGEPRARLLMTGNGPEAAPYPEIPENLRRQPNEAAE